ncbi:2,5-diketo-D-gluconate reductase A [Dysgonomonas sp. PFB1-18]|uniref:aldo/keto reductase n=1 Tax=unclassified Dysgonomonas TaxID=2630389 RepID=UPI002473ADFC|nr:MULTISPECIES: aldo/keto reductase [unclassified Dysgonomonas]MDH6309231.1 2,5-diketo-D-gluconate reductase A [Dysgonomonas sp. PF1-14]MDH6338889.1 2,5-diketo-D-gluconate reductase A [Dysgonomonas sp. PF1-16]MDH6380480.1 2,5-diketo-D-gluconate reductase A [Dysgonomonas sp. PFB1-18]MDH6397717.1 2,5-diketo-D-gluconate reductase A [Dysgonomonas sp. PF1-23]
MKKLGAIILCALLTFSLVSCNQPKKSATTDGQQSDSISIPTVTLNNGVKMPVLGFGTLELKDSVGINSVAKAIASGYRLIDTAPIYGNETEVGAGIKRSGIDRKELFITTKLWVDDMGYESAKKALESSLQKLGVDYIDLYLIHRPRGDVKGSWQAMEELYEAGKIKAIGVSNFDSVQLNDLLSYAKIKPAVNQIETHPFFQQFEAQDMLKKLDIQMEAWSPFAGGRNAIFDNPVLAAIGKKYNKTNAQVALRWIVQRGIVTIPRTDNEKHMLENISIFDFELNDADMKEIAALDLNTTQFPEWE